MLSEEGVKVGFVSESAGGCDLLDRPLLLFCQKLLCVVQPTEIQEFMKRTSRKGSEIAIQLRAAYGELLGDRLGIDVVHEVDGNVTEYTLNIEIESSDGFDLAFVAQTEQIAQKQNHRHFLFIDVQLPWPFVGNQLTQGYQFVCLGSCQLDHAAFRRDRLLIQRVQVILFQDSLGEVKYHSRKGRLVHR